MPEIIDSAHFLPIFSPAVPKTSLFLLLLSVLLARCHYLQPRSIKSLRCSLPHLLSSCAEIRTWDCWLSSARALSKLYELFVSGWRQGISSQCKKNFNIALELFRHEKESRNIDLWLLLQKIYYFSCPCPWHHDLAPTDTLPSKEIGKLTQT